jgi:hypothetical protein
LHKKFERAIRESEDIAATHARLEEVEGFTVRATRCESCLFSKDRLIAGDDAARVIAEVRAANTYFICHEYTDYTSSHEDDENTRYAQKHVCCKGYYDAVGADSQQVRMAQRMGIVTFVDRDGNVVGSDSKNEGIGFLGIDVVMARRLAQLHEFLSRKRGSHRDPSSAPLRRAPYDQRTRLVGGFVAAP